MADDAGHIDNTGAFVQTPKKFRAQNFMQSMRALAAIPRGMLNSLLGTAGGTRDPYETFGWDRNILPQMMYEMYYRGGIAKRIIHAYPDATWGKPPEVTATQAWTNSWNELVEDLNLWSIFHRLDRLSRLGRYAVLLLGDGSTNLEMPAQPTQGKKLLFVQPYAEENAQITKWGMDPGNERFGLPVEYTIYPSRQASMDRRMGGGSDFSSTMPSKGSFKVHWSRVIHVAQGQLESDYFAVPMLWPIWNYLTDLQKVTGGSAESYWLTANRGMHADVDKDTVLEAEDEAALSEELDEYHAGLRRFIRTRGVKVTSLGSEVANPKGPFEVLVTLIAGAIAVPQRILLGSEAAHNASTQDKGNWAERVNDYRNLEAMPHFLKPVWKHLMMLGVLPQVKMSKIAADWPDAYVLSPLEEGQMANQMATAANNLGLAIKNVPNLMMVEEMRKALTLPEKPVGTTKPEQPPQPAAKQVGGSQKGPDGGSPKTGPGSGNTSTPGSDSNGSGDPVQGRKATNP